jgi:DNA-binding NarL/FixJ family response regulator
MDAPPVQYVTTSDGYSIACAVSGQGRPFVFMHPLGHVQYDWQSPATGPWLEALSKVFRLVQFDSRGQGLSTRGLPEDMSVDDYEKDLDAAITGLMLGQPIVMAMGFAGHTAIRYAAKRTDQVSAIVLLHSSAKPTDLGQLLNVELAKQDWEIFLQTVIASPAWSREERLSAVEGFRQSTTQVDWLLRQSLASKSDITDVLSSIKRPVLVLHARGYSRYPAELSAELAAQIPHARLAMIDGDSALGDASSGVASIERFLLDNADSVPNPLSFPAALEVLSAREIEVLRLLATGRSNQQIADELVISVNTVIRHVANIFDKTGAANRVEAASYATRHGLTP